MKTLRRSGLRLGPARLSLLRRCSLAVVGVLAIGLGAAPNEKDRPEKLVLFDGKSLDGWKKTDFAHPGEVKVEDGILVLSKGRAITGITSTRTDLPKTNFELTYEAQRLTGNDFFAAATFPVGASFITFVNGGWGSSVTGLSSLDGADASENETNHYVKYQNATWYKFHVRVTAEMIHASVDDKEIIAVAIKDRQIGTRLETRSSQPLGFATWDTTGALRNIEVRLLTTAEVEAVNKSDQ